MKGLGAIGSSDDPDSKIFSVQSEIDDLKQKELETYAEIGKKAVETDAAKYSDLIDRLRLIQSNIEQSESKLQELKSAKDAEEKAKKEEKARRTCPSCGHENQDGVKFCQECGSKLGEAGKPTCPSCGAQNPPGTKFCGDCGARLSEA